MAKEMSKLGVFMIDENWNVLGNPDETRWNKAAWYHKVIGLFFKRYKNKFIDIKPFNVSLK